MAYNIPKIVYGEDDTEIFFQYPPEVDDGETVDVSENITASISGVRQVSVNFMEFLRELSFSFLTEELKAAMLLFFTTWGGYGKSFKYFEDQNDLDFVYYEISDLKFKPKRHIRKGNNRYLYKIPLKLRRVLGFIEGESTVIYIQNNKASAVDLTGVQFNSEEYGSVVITGELRRKTDSSELLSMLTLTALYDSFDGTWSVTAGPDVSEEDIGIIFSITNGGQLQYTSTDMAGPNYVGTYKIKQSKFSV